MERWKVTAIIQSRMVDSDGNRTNEPAEMVYQKAGSQLGAIVSVTQAFEHDTDPGPFEPELLAIKIEKVM